MDALFLCSTQLSSAAARGYFTSLTWHLVTLKKAKIRSNSYQLRYFESEANGCVPMKLCALWPLISWPVVTVECEEEMNQSFACLFCSEVQNMGQTGKSQRHMRLVFVLLVCNLV